MPRPVSSSERRCKRYCECRQRGVIMRLKSDRGTCTVIMPRFLEVLPTSVTQNWCMSSLIHFQDLIWFHAECNTAIRKESSFEGLIKSGSISSDFVFGRKTAMYVGL